MSKKQAVKDLWDKMCVHEGIDIGSKFVVFSENNPWNEAYRIAMIEYVKEFFGDPLDAAWLA